MPNQTVFADLQPAAVWQHFARLCAIPRPSGHEAAIREAIASWASEQGLPAETDAAGNLLIRKRASPGCEDAPGVVLQGHLDMVCQVRRGASHDFLRDSIRVVRDGDWLCAPDTTLGADNGIGVALALAALQDDSLRHGPLEVLLTADEESGMSGARGLAADWLQGRLLLNLDTEDWGEFYVGCAGGADVHIRQQLPLEPVPAGHVALQLEVSGLRGGHSGVDIHLGRGNALLILARALASAQSLSPLRLTRLSGGTARNALPRDAEACLWLPARDLPQVLEHLQALRARVTDELAATDPGFQLEWHSISDAQSAALSPRHSATWFNALATSPQGVLRFSDAVPGVVETSSNLGVLQLADGRVEACCLVRSLVDAECSGLSARIAAHYQAIGAHTDIDGAYPGWRPEPDAPLLALCRQVFQARHGQPPAIKVIHAGLECGLLGGLYPDMQMLSFGPDIRGAHAPGERVHVPSVALTWELLRDVLQALALAPGQV